MTFSDERFDPEMRGPNAYKHKHRYAIASRFANDCDVLDLACGDGYGASTLAVVARSVIGMDADEFAISRASGRSLAKNLRFSAGTATSIPLPTGTVDLVVNFDLTEPVADNRIGMSEIKRVLRPGGSLIISSINKHANSIHAGGVQSGHAAGFYFGELRELLAEFFPHVEIYGQRILGGSAIHPLQDREPLTILDATDLTSDSFGPLPEPQYFIALCSFEESARRIKLASLYYDPSDDVLESLSGEDTADSYLVENPAPAPSKHYVKTFDPIAAQYREVCRALERATAGLSVGAKTSRHAQIIAELALDLGMLGIRARPIAQAFQSLILERDAGLSDEKQNESERLVAIAREARIKELDAALDAMREERDDFAKRVSVLEGEIDHLRAAAQQQAVQIAMLGRVRTRLHDGAKRTIGERLALRAEVLGARAELLRARVRIEELERGVQSANYEELRDELRDATERLKNMSTEHARACELLDIAEKARRRSNDLAANLAEALSIIHGRLIELEDERSADHNLLPARLAEALYLRERRIRALEEMLNRLLGGIRLMADLEKQSVEAASARILNSNLFKIRSFLISRFFPDRLKSRQSTVIAIKGSSRNKDARIRHLHSA